ncbi:helix-turn-helix domain-containing protein [Beggiatoa leptomitoformis]|uniref:Helix-turn-helix domain-containing protein n=1 Tax=Beggiatoa leptomitoformis TaxID=288004 RepID=A0A650GDW9_9GAMM|nr:helix-turn-helix domain-containing protein [Beggiatoa leptomitoformis]QGX04116.1 helix-turn-helix domain-containing protein [Beggiatoa leptomitoformis]
MKVNERIKLFRTLKGWTQEEVAEKLNMSPRACHQIRRVKGSSQKNQGRSQINPT